ncbi:MAG: ANTAR domain-containing protein [Rhodobacteraceae bacterium]|jgi:response regulator NasT|nr:ANTAR domain-containing protein [Paracoccaceae bacterium]
MGLKIVIVEPDPERARILIDAVCAAGDEVIAAIGTMDSLARRIRDLNPDVLLIDVANPSRDTIEDLALATQPMERPVALFVDRTDAALTRAAIDAGISAYVVAGLQPERVAPVLDAAIARFQLFRRMRSELETTRRALEERKVIDRAKGIVMKARGVSEDEAYALMRKTAMDQGRKLADVAAAIVTAAGLLS